MRESRILKLLRSGQPVNCFKVNVPDPVVSEIASLSGFDSVWLDQEHIGLDWANLASHIWATKSHDVDIIVRVSRGSYSDYIKPLELDATGIMIPHIMNLQDAREIIKMTRFHPTGRRPIDGGNADGDYTNMDFKTYLKKANEQRLVILQIEDPEPLEELEAIAALDGYDMLFFGPGDFSQGIGSPGEWDHPAITDARKKIVETAHRYGKFAGTVGNIANLQSLRSMGYQFISLGADVIGLSQYCKDLVSAFHQPSAIGNS
jgi:4-hydroxy-2-oxoheptanedioate aldolase